MKKIRLLLLLVVFTTTVHAQLTDLNLIVTKTDETCLGNGSISFNCSNVTPGATLLYKVYKLPNTATPISILATGNFLGSLTSGTYRVEAIQALGSLANSKQQDVVINNAVVPFNFTVASQNQSCASGGNLIVTATSGTAAAFEIISGPVTRPLQTLNVFTNLGTGTYNIRAFDVCGTGKVKTFTLTVQEGSLSISDPYYENADMVCDTITVLNKILPTGSTTINYPVAVKHTLTPMSMSGESVIIDQYFESGNVQLLEVSAVMPRYMTDSYTYELRVTDNCNAVYERTDLIVDPAIGLELTTGDAPCGKKYISVDALKHKAPYSLEFLDAPAGFIPADFNANAGGTFTEDTTQFGSENQPVPFGTYVIKITDACGREATASILVEFVPPIPVAKGTNNGCFSEFGRIRINVPENIIISAVMIDAPDAYKALHTMPKDVTGNINSAGTIALNNMPLGVYVFRYTDNCGNEFESEVEVPPFVERDFNSIVLPACSAGLGSFRIRSGNGKLTSVIITGAPSEYGQPGDVSSLLTANGHLYMNNLPQGTYYIRATDICGIVKDMAVNVEGYMPSQNNFTFTPNCGSFAVKVTDTSNGLEGSSFWLQKYDAVTGTWGHPATGTAYAEGTMPAPATGIALTNNSTRNNLTFSGKFRILKKFESFGNGTDENVICLSVLGEFEYFDGLTISNAYSLACVGEPNTVYIETTGYPVSFKIIKKNNASFVVDNGTNSIFHNLEPADYVFRVEDACGNVVVKPVSVQMLPSITEASQPTDMVSCVDAGTSGQQVYRLYDQNVSVLGTLPSALYTITYHLTQADADSGANPLPEYYTGVSNGQVIFARLIHNEIPLCHGTTSFRLYIGQKPEPVITTSGMICDGNAISLTVNAGYNEYTWSHGANGRIIYVAEPGIYTVTVKKYYGDQYCQTELSVEVKASSKPKIVRIDTKDWSTRDNSITVYAEGSEEYLYSLDGVNYQESNVFDNLECGLYTVYVKDGGECGVDVKEVALLHYPNYFTPNGDGVHEKWQIKYSILEPQLKVQIYDRYGKLITSFGAMHDGWDGTLNGMQLPSTDYWFVVTRADGREYRGHFAMVR